MADDFTWIDEPAALVRVGDDLAIWLYDAARVDAGHLERSVRYARTTSADLFQLAFGYRSGHTYDVDLSKLLPEDGAEDGTWSLIDLIDHYMEIHQVVNARRVGERVELTSYTDRMSEGSGPFVASPDCAWNARVACDAQALRGALEDARSTLLSIRAREERARGASANTERDAWLAWASDPNPRVRAAVIANGDADLEAIASISARGEDLWTLARRRELPPESTEHIYASGNHELARLMVEHDSAPRRLLQRAVEDARGRGRHDARTTCGAKARHVLATRMLEGGADLDEVFGELRSLLDTTPCEEAAHAVFGVLEAAHRVEPGRVAERWVPYARDHMRAWEKHDCVLPARLVTRWTRHREISAAWGVARVLDFQRRVAGTSDSAWTLFAETPFLGAVESLGVRQQVGPHALGCIARASLPKLTHLVLVNWGDSDEAPDASVLADAAWVPQLEHVMLGSYSVSSDALARMLTRAARLTWLSLHGIDLDASHVDALVASGANLLIRYLSVNDADVADALAALERVPTPNLDQIQIHHVDVSKERVDALSEAMPHVRITMS